MIDILEQKMCSDSSINELTYTLSFFVHRNTGSVAIDNKIGKALVSYFHFKTWNYAM